MKILFWQERHPTVKGGAESWLMDCATGLRSLGHDVAWLQDERIGRALDEFQPDMVIVGTIHCFIGIEHAEILVSRKAPAVWFLHDYWPFCGPRMLMRNQNNSDLHCEAVEGRCRNSCGHAQPVPEVVKRLFVVVPCQGTADIMRRNGVRVDAVIEEGIDTELFKPDPSKRTGQVSIMAGASGDFTWKGLHILKRAMAEVDVCVV